MSRNVAKFIFEFFDSEIYFATFRNFRDFLPQTLFDLVAKYRDFSQANGEITRHKKFTSRFFASEWRNIATQKIHVATFRMHVAKSRDFSQGVSRHKKFTSRLFARRVATQKKWVSQRWRLYQQDLATFEPVATFRQRIKFSSRLFAICVATFRHLCRDVKFTSRLFAINFATQKKNFATFRDWRRKVNGEMSRNKILLREVIFLCRDFSPCFATEFFRREIFYSRDASNSQTF